MGRMLLILVVGGGMLFSIANLNMNRSNSSMTTNAVAEYQSKEAKDFAKSGIEFAARYLADDSTWTGTSKTLNGGSVTITAQTTNSQYYNGPNVGLTSARLVTSIGVYGNQSDTIRAVLQLPNSNNSNPPPPDFMNYAIATGNNLTLNGNVSVQDNYNQQSNNNNDDEEDDDNNHQSNNSLQHWNADLYTNGDFRMNGNNTINGFVTYCGNAQANPAWRLSTSIVPNQNPENKSSCNKGTSLDIPTFNAKNYKSKANSQCSGNKTYTGNISLGTKDNPQVIYVDGDLTINGTVSGYGVFIVNGNILVNGNVNLTAGDPSVSNIGFYTTGDLNANGNVTINAQILAGGNVNLNGNCKIYGSITADGTTNFNGNVNIYYKPANGNLTKQFFPSNSNSSSSSTIRPSILSYYE